MNNIELLVSEGKKLNQQMDNPFNELGWFKSTRKGPTGIGKTFEDLLGKKEDNNQAPDFHGIELKAHDSDSNSLITLFTKAPTQPAKANSYLKETFGYGEPKKIHCTIKNQLTPNYLSNHFFKMVNDKKNQMLVLNIYNDKEELVDNTISWSYNDIQKVLNKKLSLLGLIHSRKKVVNKETYYKYDKLTIISNINLESFLEAFDDGHILIDIRIGTYKSGKYKGKTHDHGTGFRIKQNLLKQYFTAQDFDL